MSHLFGDPSRARPPVPPFSTMGKAGHPRKMGIADAVFAPSVESRDVLSPIRLNNLQSRQLKRTVIRHPIPRPALIPDVFASIDPSTTPTSNNTSKRSREGPVAPVQKRPKVDKVEKGGLLEVCTGRHKAEEERWKLKWVKAFPTLVFHFEIGSETAQRKALIARVTNMGAKVDQFLSKSVTHVIVKSLPSPSKKRPEPKHAHRESPMNPFLDNTGVTDLVRKAEALNMKVWTEEKLGSILAKLAPQQLTATDSLHTLLEDEKLHGTRERDLTAPRSDHYYFKSGSRYLLVEDATGRHRTIMTKEYSSAPKDGSSEWPTLFESFLRPSASTVQLNTPISEIRSRAWSLYVDEASYKGEWPSDSHTRRPSFTSIATPEPDLAPYAHASGNSVVITSNIASTSTTGKSPGIFALGQGKDRAIAQMSKRIQVLKGNAAAAAASKRQIEQTKPPVAPVVQAKKVFMTQDQVIRMLRQVKAPTREEPPTKEARIRNREKVDAGLKGREQETAAGYCENCRLRYTDLSVHIASKKHQRFATDPTNFTSLDNLLALLVRPLNLKVFPPDQPLCWDEHHKDAECAKCAGMPSSQQSAASEEYDEEMSSSQQSSAEDTGDGQSNAEEDVGDEIVPEDEGGEEDDEAELDSDEENP